MKLSRHDPCASTLMSYLISLATLQEECHSGKTAVLKLMHRSSLQLAKAKEVIAAVPAALARIRSSHSNLNAIPPLSEGGGTPFMNGPPRPPSAEEGRSVDEILNKLSPEYRADVARMLIRSASKALPDMKAGYAPSKQISLSSHQTLYGLWKRCRTCKVVYGAACVQAS